VHLVFLDDAVRLPTLFPKLHSLFSMFHFSTDRLAGLDSVILKITASPKVPTLIPSHSLNHDTIPARKLRKQKSPRPPLADKPASNNLVCNPTTPSPPLHVSFRRSIRRVPCSYTLFPPRARPISRIPLLHVFPVHPSSDPSLPSPSLPPSSCHPFSISPPSPFHRLQIRPLAVQPPLFPHPLSYASLLLLSLPV
jgi:hypothetical protein